MSETKLSPIAAIIERMGMCGCGSDAKWEAVRNVLRFAQARALQKFEDDNDPYGELILHILDNKKLLDHGTNISGSWLTDDGILLLRFLENHGCDSDNWPDLVRDELGYMPKETL